MKLPRSIPHDVRNALEDLERRRDGSNHADVWSAFVDWADRHGATLSKPPAPDPETPMRY